MGLAAARRCRSGSLKTRLAAPGLLRSPGAAESRALSEATSPRTSRKFAGAGRPRVFPLRATPGRSGPVSSPARAKADRHDRVRPRDSSSLFITKRRAAPVGFAGVRRAPTAVTEGSPLPRPARRAGREPRKVLSERAKMQSWNFRLLGTPAHRVWHLRAPLALRVLLRSPTRSPAQRGLPRPCTSL